MVGKTLVIATSAGAALLPSTFLCAPRGRLAGRGVSGLLVLASRSRRCRLLASRGVFSSCRVTANPGVLRVGKEFCRQELGEGVENFVRRF